MHTTSSPSAPNPFIMPEQSSRGETEMWVMFSEMEANDFCALSIPTKTATHHTGSWPTKGTKLKISTQMLINNLFHGSLMEWWVVAF